MSKKIVFFDIDGTLYDHRFGIPESAVSAINQLRRNGHLAVICTGRVRIMVLKEILKLGFDGIIAGGGTYVEYDEKVIFDYSLPVERIKELVDSMRESGFIPIVEGRGNIYFDIAEFDDDSPFIKLVCNSEISSNIHPIDFDIINAAKVSGRATKHCDWNKIYSKLGNKFRFINHHDNLIEAIPIEFSKAVGIEKLLNYIKMGRKHTYAFGDSFNDLEMLQYVEYGITMGNAYPELKEMVKYTTTEMQNDGIYNGLKEFGLI